MCFLKTYSKKVISSILLEKQEREAEEREREEADPNKKVEKFSSVFAIIDYS